ncbi:MAG TPA: SpoIIE family protein phosphatase [Thermoleophilaceae bacterium]|nr:SpoIIE family protein phosphatase [Thermoleophilaceae bacterium]
MTEHAITEISDELELERNILRELLKQAPTAVIVTWGRELRFRYISERSLEFLPQGRDELIGRTVEEVFPNALEAIDEIRVAVLDRGETVEVHDVPLAAAGPGAWEGDRYYTFIASPVAGPDGAPAGILNVGFETTADVRARKLLERELAAEQRISNQLQVSLMPERLPVVPGLDLASGFRPAGDGHEIGGDFYDVFQVNDDCWMVVVGDVCGKGAEAAAITALAKYTMRAAAIRDGADPCTVHARLNEALLRQREDLRFVSAVCAFLEPLEGGGATMSVCVAGHLPPLRVSADGTVTRVAGGAGGVLGIWDQPDLEQERVELAPGEQLVLYTDGVLDADPEQELTEEAFARMLARAAQNSAAETVSLIEREVVQGGALRGRDDVAVLVIRSDTGD